MFHTVIFDMDGTLIDTEKYYRKCWPKALSDFGYTITDEQVLSMRSLGRPFAPIRFQEMFGQEFDYAKVRARRKELVEECIAKEGIQVKEGAKELLTFLNEKGIPCVVATATEVERAKVYLERTGLTDYFQHIISATMVTEGKPSPDIYLHACEELGEKPEDCLAIEDSPNGVLSAYHAGCKVVMVPDQTQPEPDLLPMLYAKADTLWDIRRYFNE